MHPVSTTSRPIRLLIAEKGLDVEEEVVDLMKGAHHQEPFVSVNPNRMVPVLVDGDLTLTESSAILKYLAEKFDLPEYPKDLKKRARVNEAMDWFNANLYRDWGYNLCYPQMFPHHKRRSDEAQAGTVDWGLKRTAHWFGILNDHWLGDGRKYLTGNEITIADYLGAAILGVSEVVRFDLSKYPNVAAWYGRMKKLPHWGEVGQVVAGYAEAVKGQPFTVG
jgi:glutathione S-transferase